MYFKHGAVSECSVCCLFCVDHFCLLICYVWRLESFWGLVGMSEESIISGLYMLGRLSYVYANEIGQDEMAGPEDGTCITELSGDDRTD